MPDYYLWNSTTTTTAITHGDWNRLYTNQPTYGTVFTTINDDKDDEVPEPVSFDDLQLRTLWVEFHNGYPQYSSTAALRRGFNRSVARQCTEPERALTEIKFCVDCNYPERENALRPIQRRGTADRMVCATCARNYIECNLCNTVMSGWNVARMLDGTNACTRCRDLQFTYCSTCGGFYPNALHDDHTHACCESPAREFSIKNIGNDPLANDTRFKITLPAGEISEVGIDQIAHQISNQYYYTDGPDKRKWIALAGLVGELGNKVQTKEGNYAKRLSKLAYKSQGLKIPPKIMTLIGNIASDHSRAVDFDIETTRKLNMGPREFAHGESCWWSSYSNSRCTLKTNGGFALRTFDDDRVTGRVWVMPMRASNHTRPRLNPTFDTQGADAFIVFNGYRALDGYVPARILSHMFGMTYRKIELALSPLYVNNDCGYIITSEEIARKYTDSFLELELEQHARLFTKESKELVNA